MRWSVLDSVARALRLDPGEQAHMSDLLENCAKSQCSPASVQGVRPALRQLLDAVGNVSALVLGRRTEVLAGIRLAFLLLADFPAMAVAERNLSRWIILDPRVCELFRVWPTVASDTVGSLRMAIGRHPDDARANQLVGELAVHSEHFRQWWAGHRVAAASAGSVLLRHTIVGDLDLNVEDLSLPDDPDQALRVVSAKPGSPSADSLTLLGSFGAAPAVAMEPPQTTANRDASSARQQGE